MDKRHDKGSDIMHNTFPLAVTHATPLSGEASRKFSAPTHQPRIPDNVSLPRLPQQEHHKRRGKGKGVKVRAEVSKQEVEKGMVKGGSNRCRVETEAENVRLLMC